jgi:phosphopantothenoylcysteine decarboxylase/phosphopantothenate--cysteine ligase
VGASGDTAEPCGVLAGDGVAFVGPNRGEMAESGEAGEGRMAEPLEIVAALEARLGGGPLAGRHVLVTSGSDA